MTAETTVARTRRIAREHAPMGFYNVEVTAVTPLTPHLARITFAGPELADFTDDGPDQRCKVFIPRPDRSRPNVPRGADWYQAWQQMPDGERPTIRTYTIRRARPERCEVDIDFVLHGDLGPASAWACRAAIGDPLVIFGAYAEYNPPANAAWQLIAGDETALPAIAAIIERLPTSIVARVFIEVDDERDRLDIDATWLYRNSGQSLAAAIEAAELPADAPYAWVAGESSAVKAIRRHLVRDRGIPAGQVEFMGYWKRGEAHC